MTLDQIANKIKLNVGKVKFYIHKYSCFKLAGYGKGDGVEKPKTREPGKRVNGKHGNYLPVNIMGTIYWRIIFHCNDIYR